MITLTATLSPRKVRKAKAPERRFVRLALAPFEGNPGVVVITRGKVVNDYFVRPLPADFGRAFELTKFSDLGGDVYHVNLDGQHSTCECDGFLRWGMGKDGRGCKHVAGLQALVTRGKL